MSTDGLVSASLLPREPSRKERASSVRGSAGSRRGGCQHPRRRIGPDCDSTIEDTQTGNDIGQVTYVGSWDACTGCAATPNNSFRFSTDQDDLAAIRFAGASISIYGVREPAGGLAAITVDGGRRIIVDLHAPSRHTALLATVNELDEGGHTAVLTNLGQSGGDRTGTFVSFDRAVVPGATDEEGPPLGFRSGLPWLSGIWAHPNMIPANTEAFCQDYRDRPCDLAHVFVARNSWANIVEPSFAQLNYENWPGRLLMSMPLFPEGIGASLQTCATGAYDSFWRTFGNTLNTTGRQDSIVRLGWQANGNWFEWSATDPTAYVQCWRRVADAINSTADPDPVLDWTINAHFSQLPPSHNPLDIYPGDVWVDSIGIDNYDMFPASLTREAFLAQANDVGGIIWLYDFAVSRGKPFGAGEWGVASGVGLNGGGDNANFIQWMWEFFQERAGENLLYEAYFNTCNPANIGSNIFRPPAPDCIFQNPASSQRYLSLWGGTT